MKIFINDMFYDEKEAKISVFDHGLLYGDGIFEGIRIYNGKIFKLEEHVDRLFVSAKAIYMDIWMSKKDICEMLKEAVRLNRKDNGYIRLIVTRGVGTMGIDPEGCLKATIIAIVCDITLYPERYYEEGIDLITSSYRRIPVESFDVRVKSLNYLNNIMAKIEANNQNCPESIMLNTNGYVAECTGDNIFIIKDNVLKTPALYHGVLEGITRNLVLEIGNELGLRSEETTITRFDLFNADECFMTGTAAEIVPVISIDKNIIKDGKPGQLTRSINKIYKKRIIN